MRPPWRVTRWHVVAILLRGYDDRVGDAHALRFWWPDGVAANHQAYLTTGGTSRRSYLYFLIGDFAVLGLHIGPAVAYTVPTLARSLRHGIRRSMPQPERACAVVTLPALAALVGEVTLDLVGLTRGRWNGSGCRTWPGCSSPRRCTLRLGADGSPARR